MKIKRIHYKNKHDEIFSMDVIEANGRFYRITLFGNGSQSYGKKEMEITKEEEAYLVKDEIRYK